MKRWKSIYFSKPIPVFLILCYTNWEAHMPNQERTQESISSGTRSYKGWLPWTAQRPPAAAMASAVAVAAAMAAAMAAAVAAMAVAASYITRWTRNRTSQRRKLFSLSWHAICTNIDVLSFKKLCFILKKDFLKVLKRFLVKYFFNKKHLEKSYKEILFLKTISTNYFARWFPCKTSYA